MKLGDIETTFEATVQVTTKIGFQRKFFFHALWSLLFFQALRERCEELEKEKLELGCGVKARESEASRFISDILSVYCIPISSEVAALRDEKVEAEKRVEAGLKNLHQKEERITLLQVKLA